MADKIDRPKTGGRKKGTKNSIPPTLKASVKAIYKELSEKKPELFRKAIEDGIQAKPPYSFQYLQLGAHYLDGKPADKVENSGSIRFKWKTEES
jgi:hypothetical protein